MNLKTSILGITALLMSLSVECPAYEAPLGILGIQNPLFLRATYDYIGESKFKDEPFEHSKVRYSYGTVDLNSFVYFNECTREGVIVGLTYQRTFLGWHDNPRFEQEDFNTGGVTVSAFSGRLNDWMIKGFVKLLVDIDHLDFNHYAMWDFGVFGNYNLWEGLGLSLGFLAQTGMKVDRVWPVVGFIWEYSDCFRIDAVFPLDLNLYYKINERWSAGIGAQFFRTRNRVGNDEVTLPQAIWVYENSGMDARINYEQNELSYFSFHVGYTFGGRIKITNRNYDDGHHFKFKGAPYAGGELGIKF